MGQKKKKGRGGHKPRLRDDYNIYSDGSYMRRSMGAGWVVYQGERKVARRSAALTEPYKGTSTLAEIKAAQLALASIPRSAHVTLHTDCALVVSLLEKRHEELKPVGQEKYRAHNDRAIRALYAEAARHKSVKVVKDADRQNPRMREAHNLAQDGAGQSQKLRAA